MSSVNNVWKNNIKEYFQHEDVLSRSVENFFLDLQLFWFKIKSLIDNFSVGFVLLDLDHFFYFFIFFEKLVGWNQH